MDVKVVVGPKRAVIDPGERNVGGCWWMDAGSGRDPRESIDRQSVSTAPRVKLAVRLRWEMGLGPNIFDTGRSFVAPPNSYSKDRGFPSRAPTRCITIFADPVRLGMKIPAIGDAFDTRPWKLAAVSRAVGGRQGSAFASYDAKRRPFVQKNVCQ